MENMQIAKTILEQLGGNRFIAMTGAKHCLAVESGLTFKLPSNFARHSINCVRVILTPMDDYTVEFLRVRGTSVKEVAKYDGIYCDGLKDLFEEQTGLYTHL